ncbi:hypothetical protein [Actinomadura parmotrematis]|uniref:DUF4333 domain-containing protein n=1 Tax=Actinomadura parmotrematis TaxID=2864039 RepID=A0ABS7FN04_9ACTN|nr:hypothetical protein [Actinomadura parmotrematis]MBW8481773.1 hypothetical protein [Actinomadura parmotrematis]
MTARPLLALAVLACLAAGCSSARQLGSDTRQGLADGKRLGMLQAHGREEIAGRAHVSIPDRLRCRVTGSGGGTPVSCAGRTADGRPVALTGVITESGPLDKADYVRGDFTATVAGRTVLRAACIGPGC